MGHSLVIATHGADMEEGPCKIGITDDRDRIEDMFEMMFNNRDGTGIAPALLHPVAAYTCMDAFIGSGLNWLGEDLAGSIVLEKPANEIIEKLDNDTRFSRHEELKEEFDDYLPEWAADPHELVRLFTDMDM